MTYSPSKKREVLDCPFAPIYHKDLGAIRLRRHIILDIHRAVFAMVMIILGVVALLFLVAVILSAKTWQISQVIIVAFLFLASVGFLILAACTMKTHQKWKADYASKSTELDRIQKENRTLRYGSLDASEPSLTTVAASVQRESRERGRVWRNLNVVNIQPGGARNIPLIDLNTSLWDSQKCYSIGDPDGDIEPIADDALEGAEEGGDGAPAPAAGEGGPAHGLQNNMIVFAFHELPISVLPEPTRNVFFKPGENGSLVEQDTERNACRVPTVFLGKFRVVRQNDTTVGLEPVVIPDPAQAKAIGERRSWVLYEDMPADSNTMFDWLPAENKLEALQAMIPAEATRLSPNAYNELLNSIANDGGPGDNAPPAYRWLEVEFTKDHGISVDMNQLAGGIDQSKPFTSDGRAQIPSLMQGDTDADGEPNLDVRFAPGDKSFFDQTTAQRLAGQGVAKLTGASKYVRPLRDFQQDFSSTHVQRIDAFDRLAVAGKEMAELKATQVQLKEQTDHQNDVKGKLTSDLQRFRAESAALTEYLDQVQSTIDRSKSRIARLRQMSRGQSTRNEIGQNRPGGFSTLETESPTRRAEKRNQL